MLKNTWKVERRLLDKLLDFLLSDRLIKWSSGLRKLGQESIQTLLKIFLGAGLT